MPCGHKAKVQQKQRSHLQQVTTLCSSTDLDVEHNHFFQQRKRLRLLNHMDVTPCFCYCMKYGKTLPLSFNVLVTLWSLALNISLLIQYSHNDNTTSAKIICRKEPYEPSPWRCITTQERRCITTQRKEGALHLYTYSTIVSRLSIGPADTPG